MSTELDPDLKSFQGKLEQAQSMVEKFGRSLDAQDASAVTYGRMEVNGNAIVVTAFGVEGSAEPRVIRSEAGVFVEYEFRATINMSSVPVACLYLGLGGRLYKAPRNPDWMDYDNSYARIRIVNLVAEGIANSQIFAPSAGEVRPVP